MNEVLLILGMAAVTFGARYPTLAILGRIDMPERAFRALRYVPTAVLTAIILPEMLIRDGSFALRLDNAYLFGGLIAGAVAWKTRSLLLTIVLGMAGFMLWRAVF